MSELQLYKQPNLDLSQYSKREIEVFEALQSPMIKDIEDANLFELFRYSINKAYLISVYTPPEPSQFTIIVDETMKMAKSKFGFVRSNEVPLIFIRGCSKEFGDFMGLSFITFSDWFSAYIKDQVRIKFTTQVKETKIPSADEIYQISKSNALMALNEFKKNGSCGRFGSVVYQFFKDKGLINQTKEERIEYWERAKVDYQNYLNLAKKTSLSLEEKQRATKDYESFMEGGKNDRLIVISRRLVVDDYFLGLGNKDLNEIL